LALWSLVWRFGGGFGSLPVGFGAFKTARGQLESTQHQAGLDVGNMDDS
jgi:hypothetical protein